MGIRIKKMLMYALTDLRGGRRDTRINQDFWDIYNEESDIEVNIEGYKDYLENLESDSIWKNFDLYLITQSPKKYKFEVWEKVIIDDEYGDAEVLGIIPASALDWYRRDDVIDYYEYDQSKGLESEIKELNGIYPYTAGHWDAEGNDIKIDPFFDREEYESKGCRVSVPENIQVFTDYLNIFTSPDVWKQLKPVLYTYWS